MASPATTTAVQSVAAASSNLSASSNSPSNFASDEGNPKATYSSKVGNAKGRVSENAGTATSASSRQSPAPKAWVSGTNPLTQRASNSNQRNGTSSPTQSSPMGPSSSLLKEGMRVRVTLDSGAEFEGTYTGGTDSSYTLKMVQQKKLPGSADMSNGNAKMGREQSSMSFQKKDIADTHVMGTPLPNRSVRSQNGSATVFRTDSAISGNRFHGERTLKAWVPDGSVETDMSLESGRNKSSSGGAWNQFEANERLFGIKTNYDENFYTTSIDKTTPEYIQRYAEADRTAREIEGSVANNSHVAEERIVDNLVVEDSGITEEDKYSGVQKHDDSKEFPALAPSGRSNKYMPPGRRPTLTQSPSPAPAPGSLNDPAIISSSLAPKDSPAADRIKNSQGQVTDMAQTRSSEMRSSPKPKETVAAVAPEATATVPDASISINRIVSPQARPAGVPNATATVERDLVNAFRGFASQQRIQADKIRSNKAKQDKEIKLHELKRFAASFKLNSPVPSDLVSIIAKDPAKQREIQEKAKRDAEEQAEKAEKARLAKAGSVDATSSTSPNTDLKATQRAPAVAPHAANLTTLPTSRPNPGRPTGFAPQGSYNGHSFKGDRSSQSQSISTQNGRSIQGLGARLRNIEQNNKSAQIPPPIPQHENRHPPTGPANSVDPSYSRRSSAISIVSAKLNPTIGEFRPSPFAATFNPNGNPSSGSSPRSSSTSAQNQPTIVPVATLIRRRPLQVAGKLSAEDSTLSYNDIIESVAAFQAPAGVVKKWESNGGFKPAYDTLPTWRQGDNEPADSTMHQTYAKLFENPPYINQTMSPPQPPHVHPPAPHQHQLPFHLQQASHNLSQRQSPRQPQIHLHNNQHNHGPNTMFNPSDDHRMMPSHSAQSFSSPRLHNINVAYASPMSQPAQLAYNQQMVQFPMGPVAPQQYRSYSGGHQFVPQQTQHLGGPVMMPAPAGNGFMGPAGMVHPAAQMMYPTGQPQFIPQGNGPPPMPGSNGYPSPGRAAPMMMQQGSQPGQSVYGMSPGMQYGQPLYAQQQPPQMPNMRGYSSQTQQYGTSPQMHQYGPPHRGAPSGNYNKSYMPQHSPHPPSQQNQTPTGPQARPIDGGDDAK